MIEVSSQWVSDVVHGQLIGESITIKQVSTDTRSIQPGDLFIALRGGNFDGHQFVAEAIASGAAVLLVDHPLAVDTAPIPHIIVADTTKALGDLAAAVKQRVNPKTIAITGSVGKTTVKEMVAAVLTRLGNVLATEGNFNNEIGVPLTLLRLEASHQYAVIEEGANHPGEIAYTTNIVNPDVAMINNVAAAHLEGFIDLHGVARAKGEIFTHSSDTSIAVINCDSEFANLWLRRMAPQRPLIKFARQYQEGIDVWVEAVKLDVFGCATFDLCQRDSAGQINRAKVQLTSPGRHNVNNALAAAAVCLSIGADLKTIGLGLAQMQPVNGRVNLIKLSDQITIIDDTYNANIESAKAAINLLRDSRGVKILIFGDMAELGCNARSYHQEVGRYAKQCQIDRLFTLGVLSQNASGEFEGHGKHFSDRQLLVEYLGKTIADLPNSDGVITILVKGSRSARMELVVKDIIASYQPTEEVV